MVERSDAAVDKVSETPTETPNLDTTMDKFKDDHESLSKSYKALQAEFTRKSQELAELKKAAGYKPDASKEWSTEENPANSESKETESAKQEGEEAPTEENQEFVLPGLEPKQVEEISQYAWENRELSDEHYKLLDEKGYSRQLVDEYMAGQFARADGAQAAVYEAGGGEANVEKMFSWARDNLSPSEIATYDEAFDKGGAPAIMAMENLKSKFDNSGQAPGAKTVTGANAPSGDTDKFTSTAQVVQAMSDPRYKSDPAYQAKVQEKLARSNVL